MKSKILILCALVYLGSCQEDEDDGSYNPDKYEKPYENFVDETPPEEAGSPAAPTPNAFAPTQQFAPQLQQPQRFQQPQQFQHPQQFQLPQQFQQQLQQAQPAQFQQQLQQTQPAQFQQPQAFPQQVSPLQLQQNDVQAQAFPQPSRQPFNPFPNNPFFQRLAAQQAPAQPQPQQLQPQQPAFQQPTSFLQPQQAAFRQPAAPQLQIAPQGQVQTSTNYRTNDGHQRSESVDANGNVLGEYSYVDPNGKTITVKYSAGKDGFMVQGDHIPKSPEAQPQLQAQPQPAFRPQQPQLFQTPSQFFQNSPASRDQLQVRNAVQVPFTQELPFNNAGNFNIQMGFQ